MAQNSYQYIVLADNLQLSWPSSFTGGSVVTDISDVEVTASGKSIIMPDALLVPLGTTAQFNNISGPAFDLRHFGGAPLETVSHGAVIQIYLANDPEQTPDSGGFWRVIPAGEGVTAISSFNAVSSNNGITITGSPISTTSATLTFELAPSLNNFNTINSKGLVSVISNVNSQNTYATRTITGGTNITLTNADGVSGNPLINLSSTLTGLTSVAVGGLTLTGTSITSSTEPLNLNGVTIDTSGNMGGTFSNSIRAWCTFTDTLTKSAHTIIIQDGVNVASIDGGGGKYTLNFTSSLGETNYGTLITPGTILNDGTSLPVVTHGYSIYSAQTKSSCQIAVVNASGEYIEQATTGITVAIFSTT